jgi:hypothetical protein
VRPRERSPTQAANRGCNISSRAGAPFAALTAHLLLGDGDMPSTTDMVTLLRLHAALDSVLETEELLEQVRETTPLSPTALHKAATLVSEARELLRSLLRSESRHTVETPNMV